MNENRILVKIAKIDAIEQLTIKSGEPARSELAKIGGWHATCQRGDFKVGDLVVFAEPDSIFPIDERWAFLEKCKYHIKTQKYNNVLRTVGGVQTPTISQGLILPLSVLGEGNWKEGMDVTKILGVTHAPERDDEENETNKVDVAKSKKYPQFLMRHKWFRDLVLPKKEKKDGGFVKEVSKTDEERIQNCGKIVNADTLWTLTEKVDGTSSTFRLKRNHVTWFDRVFRGKEEFDFAVCSRNMRKRDGVQWDMVKKYDIENALKSIIGNNEWVCIQGETAGPKIQGNPQGLNVQRLFVFNLIYPTGRVKSVEAREIVKKVGLEWVPIIASGVSIKGKTEEELLEMANGVSMLNENKDREGIVFRAENEELDLSFKAVSPKYLLGKGE